MIQLAEKSAVKDDRLAELKAHKHNLENVYRQQEQHFMDFHHQQVDQLAQNLREMNDRSNINIEDLDARLNAILDQQSQVQAIQLQLRN